MRQQIRRAILSAAALVSVVSFFVSGTAFALSIDQLRVYEAAGDNQVIWRHAIDCDEVGQCMSAETTANGTLRLRLWQVNLATGAISQLWASQARMLRDGQLDPDANFMPDVLYLGNISPKMSLPKGVFVLSITKGNEEDHPFEEDGYEFEGTSGTVELSTWQVLGGALTMLDKDTSKIGMTASLSKVHTKTSGTVINIEGIPGIKLPFASTYNTSESAEFQSRTDASRKPVERKPQDKPTTTTRSDPEVTVTREEDINGGVMFAMGRMSRFFAHQYSTWFVDKDGNLELLDEVDMGGGFLQGDLKTIQGLERSGGKYKGFVSLTVDSSHKDLVELLHFDVLSNGKIIPKVKTAFEEENRVRGFGRVATKKDKPHYALTSYQGPYVSGGTPVNVHELSVRVYRLNSTDFTLREIYGEYDLATNWSNSEMHRPDGSVHVVKSKKTGHIKLAALAGLPSEGTDAIAVSQFGSLEGRERTSHDLLMLKDSKVHATYLTSYVSKDDHLALATWRVNK